MAEDENVLDFNFWPSFSDLMLAFVLTLLVVLYIVTQVLTVGNAIPEDVKSSQAATIDAIKVIPGVRMEHDESDMLNSLFGSNQDVIAHYRVSITNNSEPDIRIEQRKTAMRFSFSSQMLFEQDAIELNETGQNILRVIGNALLNKRERIREIQIQGHADPVPSRRTIFERRLTNLELAAFRSMNVFFFLQDSVGFNPTEQLMSATSFGEYNPVERVNNGNSEFNDDLLVAYNETDEQ